VFHAVRKVLINPKLPFRRHFVLFLIMALLAAAQLSWWVIFQVHEGRRVADIQHGLWRQQLSIAGSARLNQSEADFAHWLGQNFPDLELRATGELTISPAALERLDRVAAERMRMFISEGGFFALLLLGGVLYMYRTLREEIATEHRQSVFLSATSHELKTPITSLRLYLDTLIDRELPSAKRAELLTTMRADLDRLNDLIERLLQAQKFMKPARKNRPGVIDISDETERVAKEYLARIDRTKYTLNVDVDMGLTARADGERWQLVVKNLIDNALKYSPRGGTIDLYLTKLDGTIRFTVSDAGQGFDVDQSELIFQRFYRIGSEETRATQGVGLGLYLVREIVESCGGHVRAESDGTGKGARFIVELPFAEDSVRG
jgi:signal transduction histidine kinase